MLDKTLTKNKCWMRRIMPPRNSIDYIKTAETFPLKTYHAREHITQCFAVDTLMSLAHLNPEYCQDSTWDLRREEIMPLRREHMLHCGKNITNWADISTNSVDNQTEEVASLSNVHHQRKLFSKIMRGRVVGAYQLLSSITKNHIYPTPRYR